MGPLLSGVSSAVQLEIVSKPAPPCIGCGRAVEQVVAVVTKQLIVASAEGESEVHLAVLTLHES